MEKHITKKVSFDQVREALLACGVDSTTIAMAVEYDTGASRKYSITIEGQLLRTMTTDKDNIELETWVPE